MDFPLIESCRGLHRVDSVSGGPDVRQGWVNVLCSLARHFTPIVPLSMHPLSR